MLYLHSKHLISCSLPLPVLPLTPPLLLLDFEVEPAEEDFPAAKSDTKAAAIAEATEDTGAAAEEEEEEVLEVGALVLVFGCQDEEAMTQ